jgi:glycerol-1-phosphate dehydrogenase [NAD(P)+]
MSRVEMALKNANETRALVIGSGVLTQLAEVFRAQFPGRKAVVVADAITFKVAGRQIQQLLDASGIEQCEPFIFREAGLYAEIKFVNELEHSLNSHDAIPIAVGSGTINDLVKLSSFRSGRRYMCAGTAASMDGYTAFGASITSEGAKQTFKCPAPQAVIADLDIICGAPSPMTASGYADLFSKITAGADWILADSLGIEPVDERAWSIVQGGLKTALQDPEGARQGKVTAIEPLIEGLMLGGFAMQAHQSSRPASGAEHQFSHLWDMEHHKHNGKAPSHGFKVGIGMLAVTALYELLLKTPIDKLDVELCCNSWPTLQEAQERSAELFKHSDFPEIGVQEYTAKYVDQEQLAQQLNCLKENWTDITLRLKKQLYPFGEVKRRLMLAGAPTEPEQIGISRERLRDSFIKTPYIRRRFTVLDVALRTGKMEEWLNMLFGPNGLWEI